MTKLKYIFRSRLAFAPVDPLGDGLREMIRREQREPGAIRLHEEEDLGRFWQEMERDIHGGGALEFAD